VLVLLVLVPGVPSFCMAFSQALLAKSIIALGNFFGKRAVYENEVRTYCTTPVDDATHAVKYFLSFLEEVSVSGYNESLDKSVEAAKTSSGAPVGESLPRCEEVCRGQQSLPLPGPFLRSLVLYVFTMRFFVCTD
jgi:hypothetical protein